MSRKLLVRPEATLEVEEAAEWYEGRVSGLGSEFLRAFDAVVASILRNPQQYARVEGEVRRAWLRRFPYAIIFEVLDDATVLMIACFHARRDPKVWRDRV